MEKIEKHTTKELAEQHEMLEALKTTVDAVSRPPARPQQNSVSDTP
jgi:hypothetical protein